MISDTPQSFLGRLNLSIKLALTPFIFISGMVLMMVFVVYAQQARRSEAPIIDIIGRQRTLNQWYGKDLILATLKQPQNYTYWRDTFEETNQALLHGGSTLAVLKQEGRIHISAAPTPEIIESIQVQQKLMKEIIALEDTFLKLSPREAQYQGLIQNLEKRSLELHLAINKTVMLYQRYSIAQIDEMNRNVIVLGFLLAVLALLLNGMISRGISRPLLDLAKRAQSVSQGDLSGAAIAVRTQDEVGQLTDSFNLMSENLRTLNQQNISNIRDLSASISEILASTQQQTASTQEQVSALQETTATMEEVRQSGQQISERAHQVATDASVNDQLTAMGLESIQHTVNNMSLIGKQVNEVAENIVSLSEKNRAVGNIIELVKEISEQSNLLSLNAAIEAAAAGEQGRSFGVVASEMKHLANQAKEATTQVRNILEEIQHGITKAVMVTEEAVKKVEAGHEQTQVADQTIRKMAHSAQQGVQAFQQIVAATNQQQIGFEQVFQALKDIRQGTEQTAVSTQQMNRACDALNGMSQQLQSGVSRYQL